MKKTKRITDTNRLKALIGLCEMGSSDFDQALFFARQKTKTELAAWRKALDQWIKDRQ